ncbi:hypothetical protein J4450_04735 [Candidatus Micrarchaeota archaeon]|nr:hypothetical protein [Candidatus Micrarchaeota archaeon]
MKLRITDVRTRTENRSNPLARVGRFAALGFAVLTAGCFSEKPRAEKPPEPVAAAPAPTPREIPTKLVENRCTVPGTKEDVLPDKLATPRDVIRAFARYNGAKVEVTGEGTPKPAKVYSIEPLPEPASNGICVGGVNVQIVRVAYVDGKKTGYSDGDSVSMMIRLIVPAEEASPSMGAVSEDYLNGRLGLVPVAVGNEKFWMLQADVGEKGKLTRWKNIYLPDYPFGQMLARVTEDDAEAVRGFDVLLHAANEVLRKLPTGKKS